MTFIGEIVISNGERRQVEEVEDAGDYLERKRAEQIAQMKSEHYTDRPMRGLGATSGREQQARRAEVHRLNQPVRKLPAGV